uniref:Secreted protein n=1 Tax=Oryza barthii TaxID=65489 RepID=A0A0D3FUA2_9ORYZ
MATGTEAGTLMVRTLLVMSCVARLDDEDNRGRRHHGEGVATSRWPVPSADAKYQVIDRFYCIAISWFHSS